MDPAAHGYGPVEVSLGGFPAAVIDDRVVNTSKLLGGRFSYNQDLNAGDFVGVGMSHRLEGVDHCSNIVSRLPLVFCGTGKTQQFCSGLLRSSGLFGFKAKSLGLD